MDSETELASPEEVSIVSASEVTVSNEAPATVEEGVDQEGKGLLSAADGGLDAGQLDSEKGGDKEDVNGSEKQGDEWEDLLGNGQLLKKVASSISA